LSYLVRKRRECVEYDDTDDAESEEYCRAIPRSADCPSTVRRGTMGVDLDHPARGPSTRGEPSQGPTLVLWLGAGLRRQICEREVIRWIFL